jgi:NADH-ubiquinone oxidoreductase chain 6
MLINIRISELQSDTNNSIPLTIIIGISLSYSLFQLLPYDIAILSNFNSNLNNDLFGFSFNGASSEDNNLNFIFNTNKDLFFTTSKI